MKAYVYSHNEVGLTGWPDGLLRLDGFETVTDPKEADVFVCPGPLILFPDVNDMDRFRYMQGNEERHVFFDISENSTIYGKKCIFFRCNLKTWMLAGDVNSVSWPWPAENFAECVDIPDGGFKYDVSFHGWLNYATRMDSTQACLDHPELVCDMARHVDFTGSPHIYDQPEGLRRRAAFRVSMRNSRICLCPESIPGDFPYRFFEAMSAARMPCLVGTNQVMPFADEIPYDDFILHVPSGEASHTGKVIRKFIESVDDAEIIRRGKLARKYFMKYLFRDDWPKSMRYVVQKKMRELGLSTEKPSLK